VVRRAPARLALVLLVASNAIGQEDLALVGRVMKIVDGDGAPCEALGR